MSFREFILNTLIASLMFFGIMSGLRYFFPTYFGGVQSSQEAPLVIAQRSRDQVDPITYEVDFIDDKPVIEPVVTTVETNNAQFVFSSEGAAVINIAYKHLIKGHQVLLEAFHAKEHEDRAFLLAFPEKTPLYYELAKHESLPDREYLVYSYSYGKGSLLKEFTIDKVTSRIDLTISLTGVSYDNPMRMRILYPSPLLPNLANNNVRALANDGSKVVIYSDLKLVTSTRMWTSPVSLFGADDKYFIHALVSDPDSFVSRAYYKFSNIDAVTAYVESQPVKFDKKWNLGFYFGPKTVSQIDLVDSRLEKTLDYGWLSPLARLTLKVMNGTYDYVKNYGIAIILFTILTSLLLLPLSFRFPAAQSQKNELNKKLQYINQKYKNDPEMLNREREQLIASHMTPGMLGGCLPLMLKFPLFFALNRVLSSSIELYKASFLWIPNLAAKDPYYLLPVCIFFVMAFASTSGVIGGKSSGKNLWSGLSMALIFAAIGSSLPAGLALYILTANVMSILENMIIARFKRA